MKLRDIVRHGESLTELLERQDQPDEMPPLSPEPSEEVTQPEEDLTGTDPYSVLWDYPIKDPNGPSFWTKIFYRPSLIQTLWRYHGALGVADQLRLRQILREGSQPVRLEKLPTVTLIALRNQAINRFDKDLLKRIQAELDRRGLGKRYKLENRKNLWFDE